MAECDQQLQKHLAQFADKLPPQPPEAERELQKENPARKRRKPPGNAPRFNLNGELQRITGVDLTQIDSVDVLIAQTIISEVGLDMSRWKTEAHFASWPGLCPDNRIGGDKVLRRGTRHVVNRAANALCMAAHKLIRSRSYLSAQYRAFAPSSGPRRPSPPWLTDSLASSIACSNTDSNTSTKAIRTTRIDIASDRSCYCERKRPISASQSSTLSLEEQPQDVSGEGSKILQNSCRPHTPRDRTVSPLILHQSEIAITARFPSGSRSGGCRLPSPRLKAARFGCPSLPV
jgi:hypothetical protein